MLVLLLILLGRQVDPATVMAVSPTHDVWVQCKHHGTLWNLPKKAGRLVAEDDLGATVVLYSEESCRRKSRYGRKYRMCFVRHYLTND